MKRRRKMLDRDVRLSTLLLSALAIACGNILAALLVIALLVMTVQWAAEHQLAVPLALASALMMSILLWLCMEPTDQAHDEAAQPKEPEKEKQS